MEPENNEQVLFFHSKAELDPKGQGKRMTICCIVSASKMSYGISRGHTLDVRKWTKARGRVIAEAHARRKPIFECARPEHYVKIKFINDCKAIVVNHLRELLGGEDAFKREVIKLLNKKRKQIASEKMKLEELDYFFNQLFKEVKLKVA